MFFFLDTQCASFALRLSRQLLAVKCLCRNCDAVFLYRIRLVIVQHMELINRLITATNTETTPKPQMCFLFDPTETKA